MGKDGVEGGAMLYITGSSAVRVSVVGRLRLVDSSGW